LVDRRVVETSGLEDPRAVLLSDNCCYWTVVDDHDDDDSHINL